MSARLTFVVFIIITGVILWHMAARFLDGSLETIAIGATGLASLALSVGFWIAHREGRKTRLSRIVQFCFLLLVTGDTLIVCLTPFVGFYSPLLPCMLVYFAALTTLRRQDIC